MMTTSANSAAESDEFLVGASLSGDRGAFERIVARYQSLICSLAYSATGSLSQSEDLAQETFITAWRQLGHLREPQKLRSWLCGIARNLVNNALRRQAREPAHTGEPLEAAQESPSLELSPPEQAISREEEAILWRSLERIPQIYREPLILFYREHQSVERVCEALELSEDAVHQRLSRGRKLLQERVHAFVEGALERSNPGKAFTLGVVAALPLLAATTAKAASVGTTTAKGGTALKVLFMTKTTQAIIVAAVTVTAVLTTQTVWHHIHSAPESPNSTQATQQGHIPLEGQEAAEATQAARDFLEAMKNEDWSTVARFWPANAPKGRAFDDMFTDQLKGAVGGLKITSLGAPYREGPNSWVLVPYEVAWKGGGKQKNDLRLGKDAQGRWHWQGGF
jgi:RNA polymerase sigma factor (sigma-70 family)